jgi:hypothetical protein
VKRSLALAVSALALNAGLAFADPRVSVRYEGSVPYVQLEGDWASSEYAVFRSDGIAGPWLALTDGHVLCLGSCVVADAGAEAGRTYWYRFELVTPGGRLLSFGPYEVAISPLAARRVAVGMVPNPSRGPARVEFFQHGLPGDPALAAEVTLHDLQGRRVRTLHRGPLARGASTGAWDGRDDAGRPVGAGIYFLRLVSPLGAATARVVRVR